ncbi:hypothetical protein NKH77_03090 [Streptomyces sp. M19]
MSGVTGRRARTLAGHAELDDDARPLAGEMAQSDGPGPRGLERAAATGEPVRRPGRGRPIFAALAERWSAAGKVVPGTYDREWAELVNRPAWPDDSVLTRR